LIEQEATLLFKHNLSGKKNEEELLKELYEEVIPLKDRITLEKPTQGFKSSCLIAVPRFGHPYILKRITAEKRADLFPDGWTKNMAQQRLEILLEYYNFLGSIGIRIPPNDAFFVYRKGATDNYYAAIKQKYIGKGFDDIIIKAMKTGKFDKVIAIFQEVLKLVYLEIKSHGNYLSDFTIDNFCIGHDENIYFVDTDPPFIIHDAPESKETLGCRIITLDMGLDKIRDALKFWRPDEKDNKFRQRFIYYCTNNNGKIFYIAYTTLCKVMWTGKRNDLDSTALVKKLKLVLLQSLKEYNMKAQRDYMRKIFQERRIILYYDPIEQEPLREAA